jgi:hypothetical protein
LRTLAKRARQKRKNKLLDKLTDFVCGFGARKRKSTHKKIKGNPF